ncbi:MAG: hypothetical protein M1597_02995 [Candidatus Thermoplasmatota archaeon]|nr:hypothetical protein [Candidatus Thermoplasmatota archaeon]
MEDRYGPEKSEEHNRECFQRGFTRYYAYDDSSFLSVRLPYSAWKEENEKPAEKAEKVSPGQSAQEYQEENYINALCRKYSLERKGEQLLMKKMLNRAQFLALMDKLETQSYKYVDGQECFRRVKK